MTSKEALDILLGYASFNENYYNFNKPDPYGIIKKDLENLEKTINLLKQIFKLRVEEYHNMDETIDYALVYEIGYSVYAKIIDRSLYDMLKEVLNNDK